MDEPEARRDPDAGHGRHGRPAGQHRRLDDQDAIAPPPPVVALDLHLILVSLHPQLLEDR
jgi:hypothetical protein